MLDSEVSMATNCKLFCVEDSKAFLIDFCVFLLILVRDCFDIKFNIGKSRNSGHLRDQSLETLYLKLSGTLRLKAQKNPKPDKKAVSDISQ